MMRLFLAVLLLVPAGLSAQDRSSEITITTLDRVFTARKAEIHKNGATLELEVEESDGRKGTFNCLDVVEIAIAPVTSRSAPAPEEVQIVQRNGDVLAGSLGEAVKDAVKLTGGSLGDVSVPFERIDHVRFLAHRSLWQKSAPKIEKDTLFITTGDKPSGTLNTLSKVEIDYYNAKRKKDIKLAIGTTSAVYLTPTGDKPKDSPTTLYSVFQLTDGSEIKGNITGFSGGALRFADLYGTEYTVPNAGVAGIYFKNGRVIYLSDLAPTRVDENANYIRVAEPQLSDLSFPWQRDGNAGDSGKLLIGGKEFRKGIGVHARSELTFTIDGTFTKFQATAGIDDYALRLSGLEQAGNVTFTVMADGKQVFRKEGVTSKTGAVPVSVGIAGCKEITLIVDFGDDRSGQGDFADWALARLIR